MDTFHLSIENIGYKVKKQFILNQISIEASAKQGLTLKGESGLGKSTLIKLMAGLILPTTGHIRFNDVKINALSSKDRAHFRRQFMGIAFQNPHIIPSLNVRQNIQLALQIHASDQWAGESNVDEMMQRFEIGHRASAYVDTLSGGEARRVALARAFVTKPKIVLLDEPLTGLDQELATRVTQTIEEIKAETGALIVVATHNMKIAKINKARLDFDTLPRVENASSKAKAAPKVASTKPVAKVETKSTTTKPVAKAETKSTAKTKAVKSPEKPKETKSEKKAKSRFSLFKKTSKPASSRPKAKNAAQAKPAPQKAAPKETSKKPASSPASTTKSQTTKPTAKKTSTKPAANQTTNKPAASKAKSSTASAKGKSS